MKKLKLKRGVLVGIYLIAFGLTGIGAFVIGENMKTNIESNEQIDYVNSSIIEQEEIEVIKEDVKMIKPYTDEKVQILRYFYDYETDNATQEKSILYHENTYIQNSGIDFGNNEVFDVVAVLDGTVIDIKEDELIGKIVEIKHDNNLISSYQSLSEVSVKKNDTVKQGQVIGKSGTNSINQDLGNHLHFELYSDGKLVNPSKYFDQVVTKKEETTTNQETE